MTIGLETYGFPEAMEYLEALKSKGIRFAIIRGYREMFANQDKDIDFLMNPSDYRMAISCYKNLLKKFEGAFISSSVSKTIGSIFQFRL